MHTKNVQKYIIYYVQFDNKICHFKYFNTFFFDTGATRKGGGATFLFLNEILSFTFSRI